MRCREFKVVDENGDEFTAFEIRERGGFLGLFPKRRWTLCSGEDLQPLGKGEFAVIGNGDRFYCI